MVFAVLLAIASVVDAVGEEAGKSTACINSINSCAAIDLASWSDEYFNIWFLA